LQININYTPKAEDVVAHRENAVSTLRT